MAGKLDDGGVKRPDRAPKRPRPSEVIPDAREKREEAAALVAENHQAQRQARRLRAQSGTLLDAAAQIIADVLAQRRIALAQPVDTRFRTDTGGSTGIKVIVRLQDPTKAPAARRAVVERLGSLTGPDSLEIR